MRQGGAGRGAGWRQLRGSAAASCWAAPRLQWWAGQAWFSWSECGLARVTCPQRLQQRRAGLPPVSAFQTRVRHPSAHPPDSGLVCGAMAPALVVGDSLETVLQGWVSSGGVKRSKAGCGSGWLRAQPRAAAAAAAASKSGGAARAPAPGMWRGASAGAGHRRPWQGADQEGGVGEPRLGGPQPPPPLNWPQHRTHSTMQARPGGGRAWPSSPTCAWWLEASCAFCGGRLSLFGGSVRL